MKLGARQCPLATWKGEPLGPSMNNTCLPPPPTVTLSGAKWGNPGNCNEPILFFIHKGINTQSYLALALLELEKKIVENLLFFASGGAALEPPRRSGTPFEQL